MKFGQYVDAEFDTERDTPGGDTYIIDGKRKCFAYTRRHARCCRALTRGRSTKHLDIKDHEVDALVAEGILIVDEEQCLEGYGWLGAIVYEDDRSLIGYVGERCGNKAGFGTEHLGTGRCKLHGGGNIGQRVMDRTKHGNMSRYLKSIVHARTQEYLSDTTPLDLKHELAQQRALTQTLMDLVLEEGDTESLKQYIPKLTSLLSQVGKMVSQIVTIEQKYALTASQVLFLQVTVTEAFNRYIDDPQKREEAALFIADRFGTRKYIEAGVDISQYASL
jgi:hypothetical protein